MKTVFVQPERCVGCKQCEIACAVEHSQSKNLYQAVFEKPKPRPRVHVGPGVYLNSSFPNKCRHCDPAPCMAVCPTAAISRTSNQEIVLIDGNKCISCAMCALVCPFDVIRYYESTEALQDKVVALKCDHCVERQEKGLEPACVEVCKVDALLFGEINQLTKMASTKLARVVSVAAASASIETAAMPENLEAWRSWGRKISELNDR
ncbi:MAG: 4Fe-4S dicluster domain-containing protein [Bacillota bacterium]|nr:4Fe-4S dicluster domain-containing protein [Bacillota bacterium]MDW7728600.1 4Fe-4S dicluster domain-containing protein [Bacillota bacterium]